MVKDEFAAAVSKGIETLGHAQSFQHIQQTSYIHSSVPILGSVIMSFDANIEALDCTITETGKEITPSESITFGIIDNFLRMAVSTRGRGRDDIREVLKAAARTLGLRQQGISGFKEGSRDLKRDDI